MSDIGGAGAATAKPPTMRCGLGIILDRTSRAAPINDPPARTALKTRQPILKSYVSCGRQYPGDLVGVPTGEASGLFVIDVDSGRHLEAQAWLERVSPDLPPTRWHATKSGGWHILFKHRPGQRNTAGKLARGVDTRGDGGYIIWWPFHLGLAAPHKIDRPLAQLPHWLCEQLIARPRVYPPRSPLRLIGTASARVKGVLSFASNARAGERNQTLFWCANRLRDMAACGELDRDDFNHACNDLIRTAMSIGLTNEKQSERLPAQ